jgi:glycerol kinase
MSILLYHYKQLTGCIEEVERIEAKVNDKKKVWLIKKKEGEEKQQEKEEVSTTTLDRYFINNITNPE